MPGAKALGHLESSCSGRCALRVAPALEERPCPHSPCRAATSSPARAPSAPPPSSPRRPSRPEGRRQPTLRGGRFRQGVLSGDPTPSAITLWTKVDGVGGRGSVELEVARDRGFRRVVARKLIPTSGRIDHAVKARVGGLRALRAVLLPLLHARRGQPRRALPHRAAARLAPTGEVRVLLLPGLHVRLLQRPRCCLRARTWTS